MNKMPRNPTGRQTRETWLQHDTLNDGAKKSPTFHVAGVGVNVLSHQLGETQEERGASVSVIKKIRSRPPPGGSRLQQADMERRNGECSGDSLLSPCKQAVQLHTASRDRCRIP